MSTHDSGHIEGHGQLELDRLAARARAALEWRRRADALRADGEADGVRATVAGSGALVGLTVADRACSDGGTALAERVADAITAARIAVGEGVARLCAETFGEDARETDTVRRAWEDGARRRPRLIGTDEGGAPPEASPDRGPTRPGGGTW